MLQEGKDPKISCYLCDGTYGEISAPPIYWAIEKQWRLDAVEPLIISGGADLNFRLPDGSSLLHHAVSRSTPDVVKALLKVGFDVNLQDNKGETPLHLAAWNQVNLQVLLDANPDTTIKNNNGLTALDLAKRYAKMYVYMEPAVKMIEDYNAREKETLKAFASGLHAQLGEKSPV